MDKWKIVGHTDDNVAIKFEDGNIINYNVSTLIPTTSPPQRPPGFQPFNNPENSKGMEVAGTAYRFESNGILAAHSHGENNIHNIQCMTGHVLVTRDIQGNVELTAGQSVEIAANEVHSVHALEPSVTIHWQKNSSFN